MKRDETDVANPVGLLRSGLLEHFLVGWGHRIQLGAMLCAGIHGSWLARKAPASARSDGSDGSGAGRARTGEDGRGRARTGEDGRGRARTGEDGQPQPPPCSPEVTGHHQHLSRRFGGSSIDDRLRDHSSGSLASFSSVRLIPTIPLRLLGPVAPLQSGPLEHFLVRWAHRLH
jgi:hypothetical protein